MLCVVTCGIKAFVEIQKKFYGKPKDKEENVFDECETSEIQNFLFDNIQDNDYSFIQKRLKLSTGSHIKTKYHITKEFVCDIKCFPCTNSEYGKPILLKKKRLLLLKCMVSNQSVLHEDDPETLALIGKSVPQFCHGAFVLLEKCFVYICDMIQSSLLLQLKDVSMTVVLEKCFMLGCVDGAQNDSLKVKMKEIITYRVTLLIPFLVDVCGIYPSSPTWIIPHFQLNGKDSTQHLQYVFEDQMNLWNAKYPYMLFYNMGDGKLSI